MTKNIIALFALILIFVSCSDSPKERYTNYVDPFIGAGGHGHTFPGATVPFGMVQLSPDNPSKGWDWTSGYHYTDDTLLGFSHTHLSGTGVGDLLDILILPFNGDYTKLCENLHKRPFYNYKHENESAEPGFYSIQFNEKKIKAELTVTKRTGFHRYTFTDVKDAKLMLDLGYAQNYDRCKNVEINVVDNYTVTGVRESEGWAKKQPVYYAIKFSVPFKYSEHTSYMVRDGETRVVENAVGIFDFFGYKGSEVLIKVGISSASVAGAMKNIETENRGWDFEKIRKQASDAWEEELAKIKIKTDNKTDKTIFYTAMYHSFLAPTLFSDAEGKYYGADGTAKKAEGYTKYTLFSLWDTFRALQPLVSITKPELVDDLVKSMLGFKDEYGLLPTWDLQCNETDVMIGYHAVPVIYDAYKKGLTTADPERMYEAMKTSAMQDGFGIDLFKKYGYIPSELELEAVSKVLEYSFDDWCIAQMAKDLGKTEDYEYFSKRADAFNFLFDKETGFMRGKDKNGNWVQNFSPTHVEHRRTDYTEANAWQYTWHVLHDVPGLIGLFGSEEKFVKKLDSLFTVSSAMEGDVSPDISGLIGQYAHGNEPCHHVAYLYSATSQQWKGAQKINEIRKLMYRAEPDGLAGNDDCGQMSSWYVFSALGFYPLNPADGKFWFGTPLFNEATIKANNGKSFIIKTNRQSDKSIYIKSKRLNGNELRRNYITYDEIMAGGKLEFELYEK